ncbi:MAG: hypothetical protein ACR2KU_01285 [Gammaproteobacteria bacterium]
MPPCILVLLCVVAAAYKPLFAAGTPAGTSIVNSATVDFELEGEPGTASSTDQFSVAEIIDVAVIWQDAADLETASPHTNRVLTFLVSNIGNGAEAFSLQVNNRALDTDDFDPDTARIFLDSNGNGLFDGAATDPGYSPGGNDPLLDANGANEITVFVMNNVPGEQAKGAIGGSQLLALSTTTGAAGSAPGTGFLGLGDGGIEAVAGATSADGDAVGRYLIALTASPVTLTKSAAVIANDRGCDTPPCTPPPGATIRYTIEADVTAVPVAALVITDPVPANVTYVANSIRLDTAPQTDARDNDPGRFAADTVNVNLGEVTDAATYASTFDVTID